MHHRSLAAAHRRRDEALETIDTAIDYIGTPLEVLAPEVSPITFTAQQALKWGVGAIYDQLNPVWEEGVWYDAELPPNYQPSYKYVPDPRWTPSSIDPRTSPPPMLKIEPQPDMMRLYPDLLINPSPSAMPPAVLQEQLGFKEHYSDIVPNLVVDFRNGFQSEHPPKQITPNATMVAAGGFR